MQPTACIRCHGTDLVEATFAGAEGLRIVVDAQHSSLAGARVCLSCGAVLITAAEPGALRVGPPPRHDVQEADF